MLIGISLGKTPVAKMICLVLFLSFVCGRVGLCGNAPSDLNPNKYSWCLDTKTLISEKVGEIYNHAAELVERRQDFFSNANSFYYTATKDDKIKLILVLSDHSWLRGVFDLDNRAKSIVDAADSLTVETDGLLPAGFSSMNWEKADPKDGRETMSSISGDFSPEQWDELKLIMKERAGVGLFGFRSMTSNFVAGTLHALSHCDNQVANTMIAPYAGNDGKLVIQFLVQNKIVHSATSFLEEALEANLRESQASFSRQIKELLEIYKYRKEELAAIILAVVNKRPDIVAAIYFGGGYSDSKFEILAPQLKSIITSQNREKLLYAAVKERLAEPGTHVIAYGALHFMGRDGIIERLRSEGYVVEPLQQ